MKKSIKPIAAVAAVSFLAAVIALAGPATGSRSLCRTLSQNEMDNVAGGVKHCSDDTNCTDIPCTLGSVLWYLRINVGVTGRVCEGSPAVVCIPDNETVCAVLVDGCNYNCSECYEAHYIYSYKSCYSSS
ncbi:MAG: hypothetical protein JSU94_00875 [Phycisphaerales bacterium]|nr:MAG: hypothetical protein JSU94_00875 [Phycisphaerales bacterium]